jgi:hypothetical protein
MKRKDRIKEARKQRLEEEPPAPKPIPTPEYALCPLNHGGHHWWSGKKLSDLRCTVCGILWCETTQKMIQYLENIETLQKTDTSEYVLLDPKGKVGILTDD